MENIEETKETVTRNLVTSIMTGGSRRSLLKRAVAGTVGLTSLVGAGALTSGTAFAQSKDGGAGAIYGGMAGEMTGPMSTQSRDTFEHILSVLRTAEQLAVTLYSRGVANAATLGIMGDKLDYLKAALIEEQIHQQYFAAHGGRSLADTFSFPDGERTFTSITSFISAQQMLEGMFDTAFLTAVKEFADMGQGRWAQIMAQVAWIEGEHRVLGRDIGGMQPANNWAFAPVLVPSVSMLPTLVKDKGFLSPVPGNTYKYEQADLNAVELKPLTDKILYRTPDIATGASYSVPDGSYSVTGDMTQ